MAIADGAGAAHRATKEPEKAPGPVVAADGLSFAPAGRMAHDRGAWHKLWKAEDHPRPPEPLPPLDWYSSPQPLVPAQIRTAAARLSSKTSAVCGFPPRLFAHLSEQALEGLALIYQAAEITMEFPADARATEVRLIGDKRCPIGLFGAVYRIWASIRVEDARRWEFSAGLPPSMATGPGRGATDAVWR